MKNVLGTETRLDDAFLDRMRQTIDPPPMLSRSR
jgi:hypothetical protein